MKSESLEIVMTEEDWEIIMEVLQVKKAVKSKNGCFSY